MGTKVMELFGHDGGMYEVTNEPARPHKLSERHVERRASRC